MNEKELTPDFRLGVKIPSFIAGTALLFVYLVFSRSIDPFNFLQVYRDYTPVIVVKIKWYMWLLPFSFAFFALSLSGLVGEGLFRKLDHLFSGISRGKFLLGIFLIAMAEIMLVQFLVLDGLPHFLDEVVYYFQAKIFAGGNLYAPSPPEGFFDYLFFHSEGGKWFARHFPGFPLILSLGMIFGMENLINPLLSTFTLIVFFYLILTISEEERTARYSVVLVLLSPFYPFMSASYMSHPASMFFCMSFIYFFIKAVSSDSLIYSIVLGFFLGIEFITRPITFTAMALPYAIYFLLLAIRGRVRLKQIIAIMIPLLLWGSFFLYYNHSLTGEMFKTPMQVGDSVHLGFGPNEGIPDHRGVNTGFTPSQGLWQMKSKLVMLGVDLFGWGGFSLIFLPFALFDRKNQRWDYLFFVNFVLVTLTYFIAHNRGMMYGARYYFCLLPLLGYFTVKGIRVAMRLLERVSPLAVNKGLARNIIIIFVIIFFARSLTEYLPMKVRLYSSLYPTRTMYKIVKELEIKNALVFVRGTEAWVAGVIANSPYLDTDIIYAKDRGAENIELMKLFPQRRAYLFDYNRFRDYGYLVEIGKGGLPLYEGKIPEVKRLE